MDEVLTKPGKLYRIERLDDPIDYMTDPLNSFARGMVGQPDIEGTMQADIDRNDLPSDGRCVGGKQTYSSSLCDRPVIRTTDIVPHHEQVLLLRVREPCVKDFLRGRLIREVNGNSMLLQFCIASRHAINVDIFSARIEHHM